MNLSIKILDPDTTNLVDLGHFLFLGTELFKKFKAQIIDLDNDDEPYLIPGSSTVDIVFPDNVSVVGSILSDRSLVEVNLDDNQLLVMISGDLLIAIKTPSGTINAFLGNSVRRLTPVTEVPPDGGSVTGKVKTDITDTEVGYLDEELVVGPGLTKEVVSDPVQGNIIKISADALTATLTNNSGITLEAGRVVKIVGDDEIEYANNTTLSNAKVGGILLETLNDGESGSVITDGTATLTLLGATSGDTIYLDSSAGQMTNVPPTTPGVVIYKIGRYNLGEIFLRFELVGVN